MKTPRRSNKQVYASLKAIWYKKLSDSGFEDIEHQGRSSSWGMKGGFAASTHKSTLVQWEGKAEYYNLATTFLHEHSFESELEKVIWEYWSNGLDVREISATLGKVDIKCSKTSVWKKVSRLEKLMKDKLKASNGQQ